MPRAGTGYEFRVLSENEEAHAIVRLTICNLAAAGSLLGVAINRERYSFPVCVNAFLKNKSFLDVGLVQNGILDNYIADMVKYASNADSVKSSVL